MRPLNILMLTSSYPKWAGEATAPFIEEIAAGLVQRGHTIHVVLPYHPELRRNAVERGVVLHPFRYAPHPALNVWGYAAALKADVGLKGAALAAAPLALMASLAALMRQISQQSRSFDLVHAHWVLPNGLPALIAARLAHLPLVVSLHGSDVYLAEKAAALSVTAAAIFRGSGGITACSADLHQRALRLGAPVERTRTVPYGVDSAAFRPDPAAARQIRVDLGLPFDAPLVVSVSRLVYKKGLTYLIEAFAQVVSQHPNAILVIGGYGDLRDELERQVQERGLSASVRFPGQLSREDSAALIGAADVHVVPSIRDQNGNMDGLPNVLLEGMSAARPIVASRLAGIPDVIRDGEHGILVPERDPQSITAAIIRLLDDRPLAKRLGANARQRVLEELTWDVAALRFEQVYQQALEQHDA
ncbi:MAG: glycosyltransferase family 4 protein [Roseiflexaceae bacterium]|nr:glycosyltransferase family 4 protein [Roseiflexaceae bacterium]